MAALTRERDQLLEQQTATADLLGIISRTKFELRPVLQTVVDTAVRLCRATSGEIFRLDKGVYRFEVGRNLDPAYVQRQRPLAPGPGTMVGRAAMSRQVVRIDDLLADPTYTLKEEAKIGGARSMISVPLMREGEPIGVIILARHRVEPFVEREIRLVTAFADQAVIAIGVRERESQVARQARSAEEALELLASVSRAANTAIDLRALALDCLIQSGKAAGCQFGQLWYPEPGTDVIKCLANSYFGYPQFADSHSSSAKLELKKGDQSIPGWVWQHRAPLWIEDLASRDDFAGIAAARAAGFKSSLALPITIDEDVSVIFEMYSTRILPFNQTVMAAVEKLGRLLGDILVRRRSELALRAAHSELARVSQFSAMGR
jgi:GAF domain-containing protein